MITSSLQNLPRYLQKGHDTREDVQLGTGSGHAVDSATRFILTDGESAQVMDGSHSFRRQNPFRS